MPAGGPTNDLAVIQQLVAAGKWTATHVALAGASALKFDRTDIEECVAALSLSDFHKTMDSTKKPGQMQDVYRPTYLDIPIYLKLKLTDLAVVVSFKRDESR
jgi:hypothetical protein